MEFINQNFLTTVEKLRDKRGSSLIIKRTTGFKTEYFEGELKLTELNFYLVDDVIIRAARHFRGLSAAVSRAIVTSESVRFPPKSNPSRIFKGVSIHPLKLHFFFGSLAQLPSAFPVLANKGVVLGILCKLGSFHFFGQRFYQSVSLQESRGSRGINPGTQSPLYKGHKRPFCRSQQRWSPRTRHKTMHAHWLWSH